MATQKKWTEDIKGVLGLDYVTVTNVPMKDSKHGPVIDIDMAIIERKVLEEILKQGVPMRGLEVKALRKHLGLSLEKFASKLDSEFLASSTVQRWEAAPTERLSPANEVFVKVFMAEQLGVEIPARLSVLRATGFNGKLILKAS